MRRRPFQKFFSYIRSGVGFEPLPWLGTSMSGDFGLILRCLKTPLFSFWFFKRSEVVAHYTIDCLGWICPIVNEICLIIKSKYWPPFSSGILRDQTAVRYFTFSPKIKVGLKSDSFLILGMNVFISSMPS